MAYKEHWSGRKTSLQLVQLLAKALFSMSSDVSRVHCVLMLDRFINSAQPLRHLLALSEVEMKSHQRLLTCYRFRLQINSPRRRKAQGACWAHPLRPLRCSPQLSSESLCRTVDKHGSNCPRTLSRPPTAAVSMAQSRARHHSIRTPNRAPQPIHLHHCFQIAPNRITSSLPHWHPLLSTRIRDCTPSCLVPLLVFHYSNSDVFVTLSGVSATTRFMMARILWQYPDTAEVETTGLKYNSQQSLKKQ